MMSALDSTSTRPYLIRAMYDWCVDNSFTPYVAVMVDETVQAPREYVKNGEIVLNISPDATSSLKLGNEFIEFKARFAGAARGIMIPIGRVVAIYARENGQGMAFPLPVGSPTSAEDNKAERAGASSAAPGASEGRSVQLVTEPSASGNKDGPSNDPPKPPQGPRPTLKRVK